MPNRYEKSFIKWHNQSEKKKKKRTFRKSTHSVAKLLLYSPKTSGIEKNLLTKKI